MKRTVLAVVLGLVAWVLVVSLLNRGLRVVLDGYVAAEQAFVFTLGMQIARLAIGAVTSVVAGACVAAIAPASRAAPWIVGGVLLAGFIPEHVWLWQKFPVWYHLTFLVTLVPLVVAGARLAAPRAPRVA